MQIARSPIPGWAWDMIERVERGERKLGLVGELTWRVRRGSRYDHWLATYMRIHGNDPDDRVLNSYKTHRDSALSPSSGRAFRHWWGNNRIVISAGDNEIDCRMVLLHELAHLLAPRRSNHDAAWRRVVARLYSKYGGPEVVAWAAKHERKERLKDKLLKKGASD